MMRINYRSIFKRIEEIRELNNQENELINHRLTWMLVLEGLMINACMIIINLFFKEHCYEFFLYLILGALSLIAFIISMSFYYALDHSKNTLNRLRNHYCYLIRKLKSSNFSIDEFPLAIGIFSCNEQLRKIKYGAIERKNHNRFEPWILLPNMFLVVWGLGFSFSLTRGLIIFI